MINFDVGCEFFLFFEERVVGEVVGNLVKFVVEFIY